nr:immunoglobulin light chain junction region [Macaca mulatta]MOX07596.1 immunoglobulin light chain junction region [Macaca mulatta]MOX07904.1 immunoglobulin light chain junction region [Macaca mulatta]MOX08081.1 immunoglobulin light chain junction region [Macaca mulatta]MOX08157.1 immunoglobulin light chain junction region [Macaca mulatta]
CMQDTQLPPTF